MNDEPNEQTKPVEANGNTRPSTSHEVEEYTPQRIAEFLLNNAVDAEDYVPAVAEVRKLGIDPATIPHEPPTGEKIAGRPDTIASDTRPILV